MAKNLKLNFKNAQLAQALNLKKKDETKEDAAKILPPLKQPVAEEEKLEAVEPSLEELEQPKPKKSKATDQPTLLSQVLPRGSKKEGAAGDASLETSGEGASSLSPSEETIHRYKPSQNQVGYIRPGTDKLTRQKQREEELAAQVVEKKPPAATPTSSTKRQEPAPAAPSEETADDKKKKTSKFKELKENKTLKKLQQTRSFDSRDRQGLRSSSDDEWRRKKGHKQKQMRELETIIRPTELAVKLPISVKDLAIQMKLKAAELIQKLFMQGMIVTINDLLDDETLVQLLGVDFGCTIQIDTSEAERLKITDKTTAEEIKEANQAELKPRSPVITFMGHVDHGKTSLIDAFRKSNLVAGEAGAITQHIGAFRCETPEGGIITLLDTPGHAAFAAMRGRGANLTDIIVLVVAGDEGIKKQTEEAIQLAKESHVPIVVAINKCDKPGFNAEEIYRQLADRDLLPEVWGGQVPTVNCSAQTKQGLTDLLEIVLLQAEVLELKANPHFRARGMVIEAEMQKGLGITATLLVQNGTLHHNDAVVIGHVYGRIKTMHDEKGKSIEKAGPSTPIKVTGLSDLPEAGSEFVVIKNEKEARQLAKERTAHSKRQIIARTPLMIEGLLDNQVKRQAKKILNIVLKADVHGSLEAIESSLRDIDSDKAEVLIIHSDVGHISESDIQLAAASNAIILGFHVYTEMHAESLIKQKQVDIYTFDVIYHMVDKVKELMTALLDKIKEEHYVGTAKVQALFKSSQLGLIAGCIISDGIVKRAHHAKLFRKGEVIWEGNISSLKRTQEDVKEVSKGIECGILLSNFKNLEVDDEIKTYQITYVEQSL